MDINKIAEVIQKQYPEQFRSASYDKVKKEGWVDFDIFPEKTCKQVLDDAISDMDDIRKALEPYDLLIEIKNAEHNYICFKITHSVVENTGDQDDHTN